MATSHMSYIKSRNRSVTSDEAVANVIRCKRFKPGDASRETRMQAVEVNAEEALAHKLPWVS